MRIGLVGCVKGKGPVAAPAADLYLSALFAGRRRFVEQSCDRWFILSALHGLLDPADMGERRDWAERVLGSIDKELGDVRGVAFEVHAGVAYRDHGLIDGLRRRGAAVEIPAAGLSQGRQLAFYADPAGRHSATGRRPAVPGGTDGTRPGPAGYTPLSELLSGAAGDAMHLTFAEVEQRLGRALPASARRHRPWWANHDGSPQARGWLEAGWRVDAVDLAGERVTFRRAQR